MNPYYTDYAEYLSRFFPGRKVQKISVNAGFSCPNRDGRIGTGGCIYCNNASFTPAYCFSGGTVAQQLRDGKRFFGRKYPNMQYIAYFQSYTNTYTEDPDHLRRLLDEAVAEEKVAAIAIGTRPDCLDEAGTEILAEFNRKLPVFVEFGVESMSDATLALIRRGHTSDCTGRAIRLAAGAGLHTGAHLIAGLPGDGKEGILTSLDRIYALPVESVKVHHLQVLRGTRLHALVDKGEMDVPAYTLEEYLDLCVRIVARTPRRVCIERFLASAPPAMVIAPRWGLKNYEFTNLLHNRLKQASKTEKPL